MRTLAFIALFTGLTQDVYLQINHHVWTRGFFTVQHGPILSTESEFHYRMALSREVVEPFRNPSLTVVRLWQHIQVAKKWKISISPVAYLSIGDYYRSGNNWINDPIKEVRTSVAGEYSIASKRGFKLSLRDAMELRFIERDKIWRNRFKISLKQQCGSKIDLVGSYELFLSSQAAKGLEQDRMSMQVAWKQSAQLSIETGYQLIHRVHNSTIQNHWLFLVRYKITKT